MRRYLPSIKRYSWIVAAVVLVAVLAAAVIVHKMPPADVVSSTIVVQVPSSATSSGTLVSDPTHSVAQANVYSAEIISRDALTFVEQKYPELAKHGYTVYDLMQDVTATPSTTAATISIQATGRNNRDAIMIANDVADGFVAYANQQAQNQASSLRGNLEGQLKSFQDQATALENHMANTAYPTSSTTTTTTRGGSTTNGTTNPGSINSQSGNFGSSTTTTTTTPNSQYLVDSAKLASLDSTIISIQGQIAALPATTSGNVAVIQHATTQDVSPSMKPILIVAALLLVGLILGLLLAGLMIYFDRRLYGGDRVKEELGQAYLGGLSTDLSLAATPARPALQAAQQSANIYAGLRLMGFAEAANQARQGSVLLVTSAGEGEGKTTLACALAGAIARAGTQVMLVDANLRHPVAHLSLGVAPNSPGLSEVLAGEGTVEQAIHETDLPNLRLLPGGAAVEVPTLLLQDHFPEVLREVGQMADVVIVDGPGLLSAADGVLLANMADQVTLVVDARHDELPQLERATELLTTLTRTPVSVVLNRQPKEASQQYFASALQPAALPERRVPVLAGADKFVPLGIGPARASDGDADHNGHNHTLPEVSADGTVR